MFGKFWKCSRDRKLLPDTEPTEDLIQHRLVDCFAGYFSDGTERGAAVHGDVTTVVSVLKDMKSKGKGVIGMKILGAGQLSDKADECLQYALASDVVDCFTIGAKNLDELNKLIRQIPAASTRG